MSAQQRLANIIASEILNQEGWGSEVPDAQLKHATRLGEFAVIALCEHLNVTAEQIEGLGGPPDARQD